MGQRRKGTGFASPLAIGGDSPTLGTELGTKNVKCLILNGRLAQLVRAPRLHRGGHRFESCIAHQL